MKIAIRVILGLLAVVLLLLAGAIVWLMNADLKPMAEKAASDALGRQVVAETLTIGWGNPLHVELSHLRLANAPWGSEPDMITLESFAADVDPVSLWDGTPVYHHLRATGLKVVLERDKQGVGNWKFGGGGDAGSSGGFALIPKNRTQFPTLLDMGLKDALITYRTYSGNILRIQLDNVDIRSPDDDSPVILKAIGAYNNTALILDAKTQSFRILRDADTPFGTVFTLAGRTAKIDFDGTMMEPLDFEGVDGAIKLDAAKLGNLLASFGAEIDADYPLMVDAHLTRKGDHWELTKAKGHLDDARFAGKLILDEGSKGGPDAISTDLAFDKLDLNRLLPAGQNTTAVDPLAMNLLVPADPGVLLDAKVKTERFIYGGIKLDDAAIDASLKPQEITLRTLSFAYAGGSIKAAMQVTSTKAKSILTADAAVKALDAGRLAQAIGAASGDLTGKLDGALHVEATGATAQQALQSSDGIAILSMTQGSLKRSIIEKASTDLRTLFREKEGSSPIECLVAVVVLKKGVATLAPFRLQAKDATLQGSGTVDLVNRKVDLAAKSERASTGFFALDLPIKVTGTFDNLSAGLGGDAEKKWHPLPGADMGKLPTDIKAVADRNSCLK